MATGLEAMVMGVAAVGFRVGGMMSFLPVFGTQAIPMRIKAIFIAAVTAVVAPTVAVRLPELTPGVMGQLALGELALGLLMGLCLQFVLEAAFWVLAPILLSAMLVGLLINVAQVLTSLQDTTVSTVPRLTAVGLIIFLLTPWMLHHLLTFTRTLFSDFPLIFLILMSEISPTLVSGRRGIAVSEIDSPLPHQGVV